MFTWGALKPGRVPTGSSPTAKDVGPCIQSLTDSPLPAHHPFWSWHPEPSAEAKGSSGAKSSAAVPGQGAAAWVQPGVGSNGSYVPFGDRPLLSLDAALQGDATAPLSRVGEAPAASTASKQRDSSGNGEEGWISPLFWVNL